METIFRNYLAPLVKCLLATLAGAGLVSVAAGQPAEPSFNPSVAPSPRAVARSAPTKLAPIDFDWQLGAVEQRIERLIKAMTLEEKIGQLGQISIAGDSLPTEIADDIRQGLVGSIFYTGSSELVVEAQRIAIEESRLGIPLLVPRDVIHGFRTVFPIPLAQAASWNPDLVEEAAHVAAQEAYAAGVNWTFAPMIDISRDARWGRIAESPGEDPVLAGGLAAATVRGFQRETNHGPGIAACAKHFVAYGLSEGGRDYNRAQVAIGELHNVFLPPFHAAADAGCLTVMTGFNSINGVPATGNRHLVRGVLKRDWKFKGLVVSDWSSIVELVEHGYARNEKHAAMRALNAGVDMEMATSTYRSYLQQLVEEKHVALRAIDEAVARVLRVKMAVATPDVVARQLRSISSSEAPTDESRQLAQRLAAECMVLLKNDGVLPLQLEPAMKVVVIGPLADSPRDQLGCWMLDGKTEETVTPLAAIQQAIGERAMVTGLIGLDSTTAIDREPMNAAVAAAEAADVAIVVVGEEWWMSGEARSRVDLALPGLQSELVHRVAETGTPTVMVCVAGRPLAIGSEASAADAVVYAWHAGTMGGPALADLLLGKQSPSGKLPVTFPRNAGQSPLYYNHPNTGRPALPGTKALVGSGRGDFPEDQKYRSHYIDCDPFPLYPFGFGLSYTQFDYGPVKLSTKHLQPGQVLSVQVVLTNTGQRAGEEVAQLYVADETASLVRPVRQLRDFRRVRLEPSEQTVLEFAISSHDLAYHNNDGDLVLEPGVFRVGVGGDSQIPLESMFRLTGERQLVSKPPTTREDRPTASSESSMGID